jgi:beta-glucanase (GH16 family)
MNILPIVQQVAFCCFLLLATMPSLRAQCWNLVWADEFDGATLDLSKWSYQIGGSWGNNELQYYGTNANNSYLDNGYLHIVGRQETVGSNNYTSARIRSRYKGDFKYGKIEARMKLPAGQGLWPAFWLMPSDDIYGVWPQSGEVDIMEFLGHQTNKIYGTLHASNNGVHVSSQANYVLPTGNYTDEYHVFSVVWKPDTIRFYVDNIHYGTKTAANLSGSFPFDQRFYILLNLAIGGNWPGAPDITTVFPADMSVDYVRVYQELPDIAISGNTIVEAHSCNLNYYLPNMAATNYVWQTPDSVAINSGQGTAQINLQWSGNSDTLTATMSNACGVQSYDLPIAVSPNLLKNGNFEIGFGNWSTTASNGAVATYSLNTLAPPQGNQSAKIQVSAIGASPWHVQLSQKNLHLTQGCHYTLSFKAKADADRQILTSFIDNSNYSNFFSTNFTVHNTWQTYTLSFDAPTTATAMLNFDMGYATGVYEFDDIVLSRETPNITGNMNLCGNTIASYTTQLIPNAVYEWSVNGGVILSGQGTASVQVQWQNDPAANIKVNINYP